MGFDKILRNLDMALMGAFEARKGRWSFLADVIYLDVSGENTGSVTFPGGPSGIDIATFSSINVRGWVLTPSVGYNLIHTEKLVLDALAGARYLQLDATLEAQSFGPLGFRAASVSDSGSAWDGIVGVRGRVNLAEKWYLTYYADIGAGESDLTWQALAGVGYRFRGADAVLAYRSLDWNLDDGGLFGELNFSGPFLGVKFQF